jgi:predicted nucleic acid-binding Zn ribbon protein
VSSSPDRNESQPARTPPEEVARRAVELSRAAARERGLRPGRPTSKRSKRRGSRDPELVGNELNAIVESAGWEVPLSIGSVVGRWREVVGDDIANHCDPVTFDEGVLVVQADSSAWATNLNLMAPQLLRRFEAEIGPNVVREVRVQGPRRPSWRKGKFFVPGRGPRDTYG